MSVLHPTCTTNRSIRLASLGLAGLLAGLFCGCSATPAPVDFSRHNDTNWQVPQTYASATADLPQARMAHASPHLRNTGASRAISAPSGHRRAISGSPSL